MLFKIQKHALVLESRCLIRQGVIHMGFDKKPASKGNQKPSFTGSTNKSQPVAAKPVPQKVQASKPVQTAPKKVVSGIKK